MAATAACALQGGTLFGSRRNRNCTDLVGVGTGRWSGRRRRPLAISASSTVVDFIAAAPGIDLAAAAAGKKGYVTVSIAAVVVPLAMAAMAFFGGYVLKQRIRQEAIKDAEEFARLVEEGMDPEAAHALVLKRIDEEYDSPPNLSRRRRRIRGEVENAESAPNSAEATVQARE